MRTCVDSLGVVLRQAQIEGTFAMHFSLPRRVLACACIDLAPGQRAGVPGTCSACSIVDEGIPSGHRGF